MSHQVNWPDKMFYQINWPDGKQDVFADKDEMEHFFAGNYLLNLAYIYGFETSWPDRPALGSTTYSKRALEIYQTMMAELP